jgi:alanine racemase
MTASARDRAVPALTASPEDRAGAHLTVDLAALVENWRRLKRLAAPRCDVGAVVKADAYGLGLGPVALALKGAGCATFYVAHLDEAAALRGILGSAPRIVCLHGPTPGRSERDLAGLNIIPVLSTPDQIKAWRRFAIAQDVLMESIVQVDTGMNRLGLTAAEFQTHVTDPDGFLGLHPLALMSHLACADIQHPLNQLQLERFASALAMFRGRFPDAKGSLSNSAGLLLGPAWHYDFARPGIALYGSNPRVAQAGIEPWPVVPVVRLTARILQVRRVDAAAPVGYGATVQAPDGAKLATVSMGYADGLLRAASPAGHGLLDGQRVPILGRISMDMTTFDVSHIAESAAQPGAFIEVIGTSHTVDDLAREAGTVGYEILTALGQRYHRRYLPPGPAAGARA